MARLRVYIKPFDDFGNYTTFTEVTKDVDIGSIAAIKREIDSTEYDAGVFKYSTITLKLANESGVYSDVSNIRSIFSHKRSDSVVKIVWDPNSDQLAPGAIRAGTVVLTPTTELVIFEGLINDEATTLQVKDQKVKFRCFGYEYLFQRMETPFSSLTAGDTIAEILTTILDQAPFNGLVTVAIGNLTPALDLVTDSIADFENKTVKEVVEDILVVSNSVLYIKNNIVYVSARTESVSVVHTFYGQASENGIENIQDISDIRTGINRTFNLWTWKDTTTVSRDTSSADKYGTRKKEIEFTSITNTAKRQSSLDALKNEFRNPKKEFMLTTKFDYDIFQIDLLDKVKVDYPTVYIPTEDEFPIYGSSLYGTAKYPQGIWSITIPESDNYKVTGIRYQAKKGLISFRLREV